MQTKILKGIRVLDLSRVLAGPLCGQLLADLGADVIKVERPQSGDDSRAWGPPYLADITGEPTGESAFYCACNRGKRSITIDLHKSEGRDLIKKFAGFKRFCEAADLGMLHLDPRFLSNELRVSNADALSEKIADRLRTKRVQDWLRLLEGAQVACGPINDIAQVFADPQVVARGMRGELPHPLSGTMPFIANPIRFSESAIYYERAPPLLGQHTREVIEEVLGLTESEIGELKASGAIG